MIENVHVAGSGISLGLTLYSLTNEWWERHYTLESLIAGVSDHGIGPGVEIVGFQSIRSYPEVDSDFVYHWKRLHDTYGIVPTCLSSNIDVCLRPDRPLSEDEMVDYLNRQLETAHLLGFPVIRVQIGADSGVLRRCLPLAEKYGIAMGMEIHAPESSMTPLIMKVRDFYDSMESPYLGFVPDFSSTMRAVPPTELAQLHALGVPIEQVNALAHEWKDGEGGSFERFGRWAAGARSAGVHEELVNQAMMVFTMHGREPISTWSDIAGQIVHVHGKCYEFDEAGNEPSIDYPAVARVLVDGGYQGWISTEWEGHSFLLPEEADGFEMVAKQQKLLRKSIAEARR